MPGAGCLRIHDGSTGIGVIARSPRRFCFRVPYAGLARICRAYHAVLVKSILVTGTSTGIGRECALRLDRLGHRVYAGVRTREQARELSALGSGRLVPVLLDVTDQVQIQDAVARIGHDGGGLAGVVNNAGIGLTGPIEYLPAETWRRQFEVNVVGQVAVTQAVLPLIRSAGGRVVFIGSAGGRAALMLFGPYCASKFAIEAISESLRYELRPWGIRVCLVEPGAVRTAIWDKGRQDADRLEQDLPAEATGRYAAHLAALRTALTAQEKQAAGPEKVARAVEHALFSRRPRTRYPVGADARTVTALVRYLPDKPREAIIGRLTGARTT
jgi:NAD(P)-dependent dehydrogenase (short-subunit alcohol dehydrogenase family)